MAAADKKLRRVVFSSSAFGMGWAHDPRAFVPLYLPLDEEHPMMPFEPYGLSKQIGECISQMVARSSTTSAVSLRFTTVVPPERQAEFPG
jgi:nucleoside-diphosphate-sugar epimerase